MAIEVTRAVVPDRPILQTPFPVLTYREAIDRFGSDKPDLRYGMEIVHLGATVADMGFRVFDAVLGAGGRVVGITAPGLGGMTRGQIDELTELAKRWGAGGLVWLAPADGTIRGSIVKAVGEEAALRIARAAGAADGDLVLIVADRDIHAQEVLGRMRVELAGRLGLADPNDLAYVWVHQFPMYQWDADARRWDATHNPFSGVMAEDEPLLDDALRATPTTPIRRIRPDVPAPSSTTSPSTAGSSVVDRSGSTSARSWPARSRSRATRRRAWSRSSGASWVPSSTARRPMAASPWASTAGPRC